MPALRGFALLLVFQLAGELVTHALGWLVPGPVAGLVLLFLALAWPALREPVEAAAQVLLGHLSLLFVPVGTGIVLHGGLLASHGLQLLGVLLASTLLGLAVTALLLRALLGRDGSPGEPAAAPATAGGAGDA